MRPPSETVRSLRYHLACALADAEGDSGGSRAPEALAELDRALGEPGADPPDARIQLEAGRLLESSDPAAALERYLKALYGDAAEESVGSARGLLERSAQPAAIVASLPNDAIESVVGVARERPSGQVSVLASTLLRHRGRDDEALELLRGAYEADGAATSDVAAQLAETLLDLDRIDEALELAEREDPEESQGSLQLARATALLIRGEFEDALSRAGRFVDDGPGPLAAAIRALSLLGLGRLDEALTAIPPVDAPQIHFARAVVGLQRLDYVAAREAAWSLLRARPSDPDALLINAQTAVEALGTPPEDEPAAGTDEPGAPPRAAGDELDAARELIAEAAAELPARGPRSRWWRAQEAVRGHDGRYRYFRCELRSATGGDPTVAELDDVDRQRTTWLQDAALEEIKAKLLDGAGDRTGAADAYDAACRLFRDSAVDVRRASACARAAYERVPTAARAGECAARALAESEEESVDQATALERLAFARDGAARSLGEADDDELQDLVNVLAWVRYKQAELEIELPAERAIPVLPWLFAGLAARPDDVVLAAILSSALTDLDHKAAAALYAADGFPAGNTIPYVAETAVVATANYYSDLERLRPLLEQHARVSEDEGWRNAIELYACVRAGDREAVAERVSRPITDSAWAQRERALATALLRGIGYLERELEDALSATLQDTPPDRSSAIFLASILRRSEDVTRYLEDAASDPHFDERDLSEARLTERFSFGPEMTQEEYFKGDLELCRSPADVRHLVAVALPMLSAARSGTTGPVPPVSVDEQLLGARLHEFDDVPARAVEELEHRSPGLSSLASFTDPDAGPTRLLEGATKAQGAWPEDLPVDVRERIVAIAVRRAWSELPRLQLEALLGRREAVDAADARLVLGGEIDLPRPTRIAIAVLAESFEGQAGADADDADVAAAADEIVRAATAPRAADAAPLVESVGDYWAVDAALQRVDENANAPAALQEAAAATRAKLVFHLDGIVRLTRDESTPEIPVVTPTVVGVGEGLVAIVDSSKDGGTFLYELIPAMRERIVASTGVTVPGVRMRGDPALPGDGFSIQVDEVPVLSGSAVLDALYAVSPAPDGAKQADGELTDFHPLTGKGGIYAVSRVSDGGSAATETFTTAQYLVHRIERVLREQLARYLGPQEVATLVDAWAGQDDGDLVVPGLPDVDARLRLTWVLQALVEEGVPITDWRALLTAVRDAGGPTTPAPVLLRAVRAGLRDQLPGPGTGRKTVPVPGEHEAALLDVAVSHSEPRHEFLRWLRRSIAVHGPAITLVTARPDARQIVSALARTEHRLITTLSEDEVVSP